jgi:hypothetical protein
MATLKKWIRIPGKGDAKGKGSWAEVSGDIMETDYTRCRASGELPTAHQVPPAEIVKDKRGKLPNYVVRGGEMVHQFHEVATPVGSGTPEQMRFAQHQLLHLLKTVLIIEGTTNA